MNMGTKIALTVDALLEIVIIANGKYDTGKLEDAIYSMDKIDDIATATLRQIASE